MYVAVYVAFSFMRVFVKRKRHSLASIHFSGEGEAITPDQKGLGSNLYMVTSVTMSVRARVTNCQCVTMSLCDYVTKSKCEPPSLWLHEGRRREKKKGGRT